jgi:hypothetical protein
MLSKIWVWDPGSGKNLFRIPGSKRHRIPDPGSGSATLYLRDHYFLCDDAGLYPRLSRLVGVNKKAPDRNQNTKISSINVCCLVPMGRRHSTGTVRLTRRRTAASNASPSSRLFTRMGSRSFSNTCTDN